MKGIGVAKDPLKAAVLYGEAADQGSARGLYLKAQCCEQGLGVERDLEAARTLYQQAADKGYQKAKEALEQMGTPDGQKPPVHPGPETRPQPTKKPEPPKKRSWWPFRKK